MEPKDFRWQVWWLYEGAWWGRKAKMLKKHWFLHVYLKGQEGHGDAKAAKSYPGRTARRRKSGSFHQKRICADIVPTFRIVLPVQTGRHFQKFHETKLPESEKWSPNHVGYVKISPKWSRIHGDVIKRMLDTSLKSPKEATCSKNTHICNVFWGPAWGAWGE